MEKVPILINQSYGGFRFSQKAVDEYNKRNLLINPNANPINVYNDDMNIRSSPLMIEIVQEFGKDAYTNYSNMGIEYVIGEFLNFINISEYDGLESINYDISSYKLDRINGIINNSQFSDHDKITQIKNILETDYLKLICDVLDGDITN
jgi:hypothetical protein